MRIKLFLEYLKNKITSFSEYIQKKSVQKSVDFNNTDYFVKPPKRVYAIGDIHGCDLLLDKTLDKMIADSENYPNAECIFVGLGDYVDRGVNSKNVIALLLNKIPDNFEKIFLKGNHEVYMNGFMHDPHHFDIWLHHGGCETLLSYGVTPPEDKPSDQKRAARELRENLPEKHLEFLNNLKNYHIVDDYFFVHAGIDPDLPLEKQTEMTMTTIRTKFLQHEGHFQGKKIIHGHTPIEDPDLRVHRVNLDTGAYLTNKLTLAVFTNNMIKILP